VKSLARETVAERIEQLKALDAVSEPLQKAVRRAVPQESELKDLLSGTWLGHPLHPPLTDVVIGAWTSALLLDVAGGRHGEDAADRLLAAGILAAVPTASAGLSDWAELRGGSRRVGSVHAIGNTTALLLHALSWFARRRGDRGRGVMLSALGYGVATFSAWLGGHLSFAKGVGVNQTAFEEVPREWTPVLDEAALEDGKAIGARANGLAVVLVRKGERLYALADRCSHRGCSLHKGEVNDDETLTCPCHGRTFRLDGSIVKGRRPRRSLRSMSGTTRASLRSVSAQAKRRRRASSVGRAAGTPSGPPVPILHARDQSLAGIGRARARRLAQTLERLLVRASPLGIVLEQGQVLARRSSSRG
jgi:nitrite reductase/ring-hydroxylating ferredoxin subunit/uncharacterized membrane protein